jgi:hypothetical protein
MEQINLKNDIQIDKKMFCKMVFLYNSLNEGWNIKKEKENYVFTKPHENKKEIFCDDYISNFIKTNINYKDFNLN